MKKTSLNIQEIAARSGVSSATVSRVLNGSANVKEATRNRVLEVIRQTNYHPSQTARSLSMQRTDCLGLIIPNSLVDVFTDPYFAAIIRSMYRTAQAHGFTLMLGLGTDEDEDSLYSRFVERRMVDGILLVSALYDDWLASALITSQTPCVVIGRPKDLGVSYVDADNQLGGQQAVEHLISLNYKAIATITGVTAMVAGKDRLEGYRDALIAHDIRIREELIVPGYFTETGAHTAMKKLLPLKPDAVFCASDTMARGALQAIREAGLRVPEDIAIVGFDDLPMAAQISPPLTTIRQPIALTGQMGVEIVINIIENQDMTPRHIQLPTELVIRESCGAKLRR